MKTTLKPNRRFSLRAGFSLVELLVVIAVIGIIAAIAIPNIGSITGAAGETRDKRNAQTIVSVASSARAAGYSFPESTGGDAVQNLIAGVQGPDVPGSTFKLEMSMDDYTGQADQHLTYSSGTGFILN